MKELEEWQRCSCYKCNNMLTNFRQLIFGVCEPHLNMLLDTHYYIGLCWKCGNISYVGNKDNVIKDKYIFSKGCKLCSTEEDSLQWMTLSTNSSKQISEYAIDETGSLVLITSISNANIRESKT